MTDFPALLQLLCRQEVEFIIIGGLAAVAHGSARATLDLDLVYRRSPDNISRLAKALQQHEPYLRGAPPGLPFSWDEETIRRGLNFTLTCTLGHIDLLGEVVGGGTYEDLEPQADSVELFGFRCLCLGLEALIRTKRAAGRPKDLEAIAELERILEERQDQDG